MEAMIIGDAGRLFVIAGPLLRRLAQRSVEGDCDRLVARLER